jgi:abortive infection bacteriophage resistance protein
MRYGKPALVYADQLALLISRNLACSDPVRALEWLQRMGYFRLSAYFLPFRDPGTDNFRAGVTLDDIVNLYKFDCGLRLLTLQAREESRSAEVFVEHFRTKYASETDLPIWMATEIISFGVLSQMYANLRRKLRKLIAREFNLPEPVFVSWLHALTAIRNACAHHARLWNRELAVKPALPNTWKARGISNHRFYVIALIIQTLLNDVSPGSRWKERLKAHIDAYPGADISHMHFPADWKNQSPWV